MILVISIIVIKRNKRKKIKSNRKINMLIDESIANKRYEDLKYIEILDIYKRFNFSFC